MSEPIKNRYDFVYLFDVQDGNPNGDPDAGNQPRLDPETGHGLVTDVCLKRKIRNYVAIAKGNDKSERFEIYVKERGILANEQRRAFKTLNENASDRPNERARRWMCEHYFDVRSFGAVMTTGKAPAEEESKGTKKSTSEKKWNCGQVRGPVQMQFGRSIDPILTLEHAITRVALTNVSGTGKESTGEENEKASSGQMARKTTLPYALYRAHGFISPHLAQDTGFSEEDLRLLWEALTNMFEHDRSAARGLMSARELCVFKHQNALGNAPAHKLFDLVKIENKHKPVRTFDDYEVTVDKSHLPQGVEVFEIISASKVPAIEK